MIQNKLFRYTLRVFFACITGIALVMNMHTQYIPLFAQSSSTLWDQINSLQSQMSSLSQKIQNEQSQVSSLSGKIQDSSASISSLQDIINQKKQLIDEKNQQITLLNQSIAQEQSQINTLTAQINSLYAVFVTRARTSYENQYVNPLLLTLGDKSISDVFSNLAYFTDTRNADSKLLSDMQNNQYILQQKLADLNTQQTDLTNAQKELQQEQSDLQSQENQLQDKLNAYASSKNAISHELTSDQQQYQSLIDQINSLQLGSFTGGSGCNLANANNWYFNQQCYTRLYGMYGTSIDMTYGCLITDIAMVATYESEYNLKNGGYYTPKDIAARTWFSNNYMEAWPSISGLSPVYIGSGSIGDIRAKINAGHPVIVYLSAQYGEHWVVLYQNLSNGDFMMNDPWYGSQLHFLGSNGHEYYSFGEMGSAFTLE